jgi:hypothetical protein
VIRDRRTKINIGATEPKLANQKPGTINQKPGVEKLKTKNKNYFNG